MPAEEKSGPAARSRPLAVSSSIGPASADSAPDAPPARCSMASIAGLSTRSANTSTVIPETSVRRSQPISWCRPCSSASSPLRIESRGSQAPAPLTVSPSSASLGPVSAAAMP
jgi:hypothetical protein